MLALYQPRWQIELAFKRLKSGLGLHRLAARDPAMARSWLLPHLIMALLIEDAAGEVLDAPPPPVPHATSPHRPVSLWRLRGALRRALFGAVLRPVAPADLHRTGNVPWRHLCDPPRRPPCQANAARAMPARAP